MISHENINVLLAEMSCSHLIANIQWMCSDGCGVCCTSVSKLYLIYLKTCGFFFFSPTISCDFSSQGDEMNLNIAYYFSPNSVFFRDMKALGSNAMGFTIFLLLFSENSTFSWLVNECSFGKTLMLVCKNKLIIWIIFRFQSTWLSLLNG